MIHVRGRLEAAEVTSFMYGDYLLYDETRRQLYALKASNGDLRDYVGQRVRVSGVPVPGYPVDGGPPYLEVRTIRRLESRGGEHE